MVPTCPHALHPPAAARRTRRPAGACGQATVELVGTLPVLALALAICVQAGLLGVSVVYAQVAVDAAARPGAQRKDLPLPAVWRDGAQITRTDGQVTVLLRSPGVLPGIPRDRLTVRASAEERGA